MSARKFILRTFALASLVVVIICFCRGLQSNGLRPDLIVATTCTEPGDMEWEFRTLVTNSRSCTVTLGPSDIRYEDKNGVILDTPRFLWNGQASAISLAPMKVANLDFEVPRETRRVRVLVEYSRPANRLARMISLCVCKLPLARSPQRFSNWLKKKGLIDGAVSGGYEGPWVVNPKVPRSEASQPVGDNLSSVPAGLRR